MKVKIKKLSDKAVLPTYAKEGDAGMDLVATSAEYCEKTSSVTYGTDLAVEIPKGYVGLLFARSSNSKKDLLPSNAVGVIDSGYRGEIKFNFKSAINSVKMMNRTIKMSSEIFKTKNTKGVKEFLEDYLKETKTIDAYQVGDRIGQLIIMPYPQIEFEEVEELSESERGSGGYGSTGN